ncbi:PREDICTED: arrestin domain-containing protein 1 [Myotis brandtii]|uniref:arrestin domain-containing protein 1 n=1 Tax=Myotis brandtii TaxID=109478 RepID=UPI0007040553|nr:PREDICTED: arrestin domain-containing protein 1 [Myotis brandtii]
MPHASPLGAGCSQAGGPRHVLWVTHRCPLRLTTLAPSIRVSCTGSCRVSTKANDTAWVTEEGYVNSALSLADKGSLPTGEHSFPFQFLLPATAPTSFEGPFGKIVYQVRATIDTPRFAKDHQCSCVFYILSPLNLNSIPDIEQPNVASTTKKFSYKLVKTGSVVLTASTDLRGYVVGQVLRLQADIDNQSGKDTGPVVASLLQKVSYKAKRWIYDVRAIADVEGAGVKAWRRTQWQEQILVPALPQSALPGCSLIHVDYYLQVLGSALIAGTLPVQNFVHRASSKVFLWERRYGFWKRKRRGCVLPGRQSEVWTTVCTATKWNFFKSQRQFHSSLLLAQSQLQTWKLLSGLCPARLEWAAPLAESWLPAPLTRQLMGIGLLHCLSPVHAAAVTSAKLGVDLCVHSLGVPLAVGLPGQDSPAQNCSPGDRTIGIATSRPCAQLPAPLQPSRWLWLPQPS